MTLFYNWLFNYFQNSYYDCSRYNSRRAEPPADPIPNFSLSVTTNLEVTCEADARIKLVKGEFKQVGEHKLSRKGVIQFTTSSFETIDSFISFVNQNAKQTTTGSDEGHNIKLLKMPPKYSRPMELDGIEDPKLPGETAGELARPYGGGCLLSTSTNKSQGRMPNKTQV